MPCHFPSVGTLAEPDIGDQTRKIGRKAGHQIESIETASRHVDVVTGMFQSIMRDFQDEMFILDQ